MDKIFKEWLASKPLHGIIDSQTGEFNRSLLHEAYLIGKQSKRKTKNDPHPAYSLCVEFWLKEFHTEWKDFNGGEGRALNNIIALMEKYFKESPLHGGRKPTVQETVDFFRTFCKKLPPFFQSKNLKVLNQNFDGIITEIRAGKKVEPDARNSGQQRFSKFSPGA